MHTYDASQFEEKSLSTSCCDTSSSSKISLGANSKASNDLSIRIDPRESLAYRALDEHFQVVDSQHSKHQTPLGSSNCATKLSGPKLSGRSEPKLSLELKSNYTTPFFN